MRITLTGASGFIGRCLQPALRHAGHDVSCLDPRTGRFTGADVMVHLAGIAHRRASNEELHRANVRLSEEVGRCAAAHGAALVFLSSLKVHGESSETPLTERSPIAPRDPYARSKARAEELLGSIAGLQLAVLRPPLVYGPGVKANFLALMTAIARGLPLPLASIRNRRSFIYVENLVDAIVRCLGQRGSFLVSDGPGIATPQLCRRLGEALGRPARLVPFPPVLLPGKLAASLEVDDSAIRTALHWRPPYAMDEGLRSAAQWYRGR